MVCWIEDLAAGCAPCAPRCARAAGSRWWRSIRSTTWSAREPLLLDFPYAADGPRRFEEPGSYADRDADVAVPTEIVYAHSLREAVSAAIGAGLRIDALHEHLDTDFDPRGDVLTPEDGGRLGLRVSGERLPVLFTLLATRGG